jgi:Sulfate permease family
VAARVRDLAEQVGTVVRFLRRHPDDDLPEHQRPARPVAGSPYPLIFRPVLPASPTGALFTSSAFMAVQATGAMSIVVADVPAVHDSADPARALFTLSVLTGIVMLAAGFLRLGSVLRFVSNAVMVGFLSAVGVNIVLGQLANFTGYDAQGANRVIRAVNTLLNPGQLHLQTVAVGVTTIALILLLERAEAATMTMPRPAPARTRPGTTHAGLRPPPSRGTAPGVSSRVTRTPRAPRRRPTVPDAGSGLLTVIAIGVLSCLASAR